MYNQDVADKKYAVYQKTEWSSKKHKNDNQETVFYNSQIDGKDVFDRWLE